MVTPLLPALREWRRLGPQFGALLGISAVFTLARFSEAFLLLRAADTGLSVMLVPLVMVVMNGVYVLTAWPAGWLADRLNRRGLLAAGLAVLVASDLALAAAGGSWPLVMVGVALWGLHLGLSQGLLSAMIADAAPADRRGTAFGLFHLVTGGALLVASVLAGGLWSAIGPATTFLAGACFAMLALVGLAMGRPGSGRPERGVGTAGAN
ncbi:membrane hypothetical protein [Azospirillaceae bacterium]